jgi:hypothetical protein
LQTYLQAGGRLLRRGNHDRPVTIQDHGGNWWMHGSLNADRDWHLYDTPATVTGGRIERMKQKRCRRCFQVNPGLPYCPTCNLPTDLSPTSCPQCRIIVLGRRCTECGWERPKGFTSRMVVQEDGELREYRGDIFEPERIDKRGADGVKAWTGYYFKALRGKSGQTFEQAKALYAKDHHWQYPNPVWPYMPRDPADLFRRVRDVPRAFLIRPDEFQPQEESA